MEKIEENKVIEKLKKEILNLETILNTKKEELAQLIEDEKFKNKDQLIVIIEMRDQFSGITEIFLIDNNSESIKNTIDSYKLSMYGHEIYIYKLTEVKENYNHLIENLGNDEYSQEILYNWMDENKERVIDTTSI